MYIRQRELPEKRGARSIEREIGDPSGDDQTHFVYAL